MVERVSTSHDIEPVYNLDNGFFWNNLTIQEQQRIIGITNFFHDATPVIGDSTIITVGTSATDAQKRILRRDDSAVNLLVLSHEMKNDLEKRELVDITALAFEDYLRQQGFEFKQVTGPQWILWKGTIYSHNRPETTSPAEIRIYNSEPHDIGFKLAKQNSIRQFNIAVGGYHRLDAKAELARFRAESVPHLHLFDTDNYQKPSI